MTNLCMKISMVILGIVYSLNLFASSFEFDFDFEQDKIEMNKLLPFIKEGKAKVEKYWNYIPQKNTRILVKKFESNPNFLNCANLQNKNTIYMHSLESLKNLNNADSKRINPFCLNRSYVEVAMTVVHEYSHSIHWQLQKTNKKPLRWIWEGLSIYLSGQIDSLPMKENSLNAVKKMADKLNICTTELSEEDSYTIGSALIKYLDHKKSKIGQSLIDVSSPSELQNVLDKNKINCEISKSELVSSLM